jgi:hypothetical protein
VAPEERVVGDERQRHGAQAEDPDPDRPQAWLTGIGLGRRSHDDQQNLVQRHALIIPSSRR